MVYSLKNDLLSASINSLGAELVSVLDEGGHEYIWSGDTWRDHAPLLFPVCGRLLDNKYTFGGVEYNMNAHGFAKASEFELVEACENKLVLKLCSCENSKSIYPFDFELVAEYTLIGNRLDARFTIKNTGKENMPYMFGWHPGFTLAGSGDIGRFCLDFMGECSPKMHPLVMKNGDPTPFLSGEVIDFNLDGNIFALDENLIYSNDTLILTNTLDKVTLFSPDTDKIVSLSYSENLPYFCIWKSSKENSRFICLEPWSDVPADGVTPECFETRKMSRLSSGDEVKYTYSVMFG